MGKFSEAAGQFKMPHERLEMLNDNQKEALWLKLTSEEKALLWSSVPVSERFRYLPPSERNARSQCHSALLFIQDLYFRDGEGTDHKIGTYNACSEIGCTDGRNLKLDRSEIKRLGHGHFSLFDWVSTFRLMRQSKTQLVNCTFEVDEEGNLAPLNVAQPSHEPRMPE